MRPIRDSTAAPSRMQGSIAPVELGHECIKSSLEHGTHDGDSNAKVRCEMSQESQLKVVYNQDWDRVFSAGRCL